MKSYINLPPEQGLIQQLVDQYNADERLWRRLENKRKRRRQCMPGLSGKWHKLLDQIEWAKARSPQDCIGRT